MSQLHPLLSFWPSLLASLTGGIDILPCGRRHVRILQYARIEVGGFTVARESPGCSGTCWMPGSIWDGGMGGTPDSFSSGIGSGVGAPPSLGGAGGSLSEEEMASAGRKLRMAMVTNPEALPDTLLVEDKREFLPHSCFDHDIFISSSVMTFEGSTYWRLSPHPL